MSDIVLGHAGHIVILAKLEQWKLSKYRYILTFGITVIPLKYLKDEVHVYTS